MAEELPEWPRTPAARGFYPLHEKMTRLEPTVPVLLHLPSDLYAWLALLSGTDSFLANVEEAFVTALRSMAGTAHPEGMSILGLASALTRARGVSMEEVVFGKMHAGIDQHAVQLLLSAASIAAGRADRPSVRHPDHETLQKLLAIVGITWPEEEDDSMPYDPEEDD